MIFACDTIRSFSSRVSRGLDGAEWGKQVDVSWAILLGWWLSWYLCDGTRMGVE